MWHQHGPVTQLLGLSEAKLKLETLVLTYQVLSNPSENSASSPEKRKRRNWKGVGWATCHFAAQGQPMVQIEPNFLEMKYMDRNEMLDMNWNGRERGRGEGEGGGSHVGFQAHKLT